MSDWSVTTIGAQVTLQRGFDITKKDQRPGQVPVVSSGGVSSYHDTAMVRGPGVVLGRKGSLGTVFFMPSDYWPHDTTLWVKEFNGNDQRFVYYFFKNLDVMHLDVGSANPTLNRNHVHPIEIDWPPLDEQRRIAAILGALDDKIELNRKMNRTLEEMAQALFKSWFIDFDGHTDLVDSELGPIPRGWETGRLGDVLTLQRGFDLPAHVRTSGPYTVYAAGGIHGTHTEGRVRGPGVVTGRSGKLGKVYFAHGDFWPLNTTLWVKEYRRSGPHHAFQLLSTIDFSQFNAGSAVPTLNRNHVHTLRIVIPPTSRVVEFENTLAPLFKRMLSLSSESRTLSNLRDTLLPRLISGELRVPEADEIMPETL